MPIKDYDKPAEIALIEACRMGAVLQISTERPPEGTTENTIRAGLIRELLLGTEDCRAPANGLDIQGAWIIEQLNLESEAVPVPLWLRNCALQEDVILRHCTLPLLYLPGTQLPALSAEFLRCSGSLHLRAGFEASGPVDLNGANITKQLVFTGGKFLAEDVALTCYDITVGASVHLSYGFEAQGEVDLASAKIAGQLDCAGGKFLAKPLALNCNAMSTGRTVSLRLGFEAQGEVDLRGAKIGGQLTCTGGKFWAEPTALTCYASTVGVDAFLINGFEAQGKVNLACAKIGGQLDCQGGKFLAEDAALDCSGMNVGADVLLLNGFEARGTVDLGRAEIAGDLKMPGAKLGKGLIASGMRVRAAFIWYNVQGHGITVELIDAQVGTLHDPPGSWDPVKELHLSSFRYDRIESDMDVQERLDWLAKHDATVSRFTPAPYVQLANVLRRQGFAREAAQVLIRREDKQRAAEWDAVVTGMDGTLLPELTGYAHMFLHFLSWVFKWMFGYGHQPARVLPWIAIILALTIWFAEQTHRRGQFAPTSAVVLNSPEWLRSFPNTPLPASSPLWRAQLDAWVKTKPGRDYESFSAWLYALDLFIPLDALGQEKNWAPSASRGTWGEWGHRLRWLVQMAGWVITAIGAAVVTGLIGRRD
jgi:hypothetical protein